MRNTNNHIYLDYNATAPMLKCVKDVIHELWDRPLNASAIHTSGRAAKSSIENARGIIAKTLNLPAGQIVFNSGATEGNNTVLKHFNAAYPEDQILISAIEHKAVIECDITATRIPVRPEGLVDLDKLEEMLKASKTSLVSVMLVNNESGIIQPITDIANLVHRHGALLHCDGVQAFGRIPIDMSAMGIDFLTLSAHKIGGPQGVGALAMRLCGETPVLIQGGGQEKGARAGTENVFGIAGFGAAAQFAHDNFDTYSKISDLRNVFETRLKTISPECIIFGHAAPRVSNTSFFSLPHASSETLMMALDLDGISVSNGSACSSGRVEISHVLRAMSVNNDNASGAIRVSMGLETTQDDIEAFFKSWEKIYMRLKAKS
jgi:cysteine desulfurase